MNPAPEKICGCRGWGVFFGTGWLLAIVAGIWAAPRIYHHLIVHVPAVQRNNWELTVSEKERELALPWQDTRPLIVFAGDSEIQYGPWYDLFAGKWAVRNCGLERSKIADVTRLVSAIAGPEPQAVVLMCGVNNFGAHDSADASLRDYEALLGAVRARLQPKSIIVLSVMPVRESAADRAAHDFNADLGKFNTALAATCERLHVEFLDVRAAVSGANGGLADELTVDGLHLNGEGYRHLAKTIAPRLAALMPTP